MVEMVGVDGFDDGDVIHHFGEVGQLVGEFGTGLSVFGERKPWTENGGIGLNEGVTLTFDDGGRNGFAFEFLELGLVIEEFELAGSSGLEEEDDPFGFDGETQEVGLVGSSEGFLGQEGSEGDFAEADSTILEELATGTVEKWGSVHFENGKIGKGEKVRIGFIVW